VTEPEDRRYTIIQCTDRNTHCTGGKAVRRLSFNSGTDCARAVADVTGEAEIEVSEQGASGVFPPGSVGTAAVTDVNPLGGAGTLVVKLLAQRRAATCTKGPTSPFAITSSSGAIRTTTALD